jgi:hypothetical protein
MTVRLHFVWTSKSLNEGVIIFDAGRAYELCGKRIALVVSEEE